MTAKKNLPHADKPATLKMLVEYLDLSRATVSIVLNNSPVATSIPAVTKQRVHPAAKKFKYPPTCTPACCAPTSATPPPSSLPHSPRPTPLHSSSPPSRTSSRRASST